MVFLVVDIGLHDVRRMFAVEFPVDLIEIREFRKLETHKIIKNTVIKKCRIQHNRASFYNALPLCGSCDYCLEPVQIYLCSICYIVLYML